MTDLNKGRSFFIWVLALSNRFFERFSWTKLWNFDGGNLNALRRVSRVHPGTSFARRHMENSKTSEIYLSPGFEFVHDNTLKSVEGIGDDMFICIESTDDRVDEFFFVHWERINFGGGLNYGPV